MAVIKPELSLLEKATLILSILRVRSSSHTSSVVAGVLIKFSGRWPDYPLHGSVQGKIWIREVRQSCQAYSAEDLVEHRDGSASTVRPPPYRSKEDS